jgi:hypothetical protein
MRHPHLLRAGVCVACMVVGSAAFGQGVNHSAGKGQFSPVAFRGVGGFHGGGLAGFHGGGHWGGGRGWGSWGPGYSYGYPYYGYGYGYPDDYAYDYPYDYGAGVYAEGAPGAYCQTPETSCELDHPAIAGQACQCREGIDQVPGTAQP